MRILAFSDLHGSYDEVERILAAEESCDVVILAGDITTCGTPADIEKAVERIKAFHRPVLAVAGNMDPPPLEGTLRRLGVSIDACGAAVGEAGFFGVSAAPLSPLHTPNEITEEEITRRAEAGWKEVSSARWKIFVPHAPPKGTALDRTILGSHVGSQAVREFISRRKPDVTVCGHIHEARGIDLIDGVKVINCGPAGKGYYGVITLGETIDVESGELGSQPVLPRARA